MLEEDIALANIALDLIGQARVALCLRGGGRGRGPRRGRARLSARRRRVPQRAARRAAERRLRRHDRAAVPLRGLHGAVLARARRVARRRRSPPSPRKAVKEAAYHVRHAAEWVVRLGDGTDESHARAQAALDELWLYTGELFEVDAVERGARRARHRRRPAGARARVGRDRRRGCSPRRRCAARRALDADRRPRAGATPSTSATCSPRCSSCSAPIRERSGERCAGPSRLAVGERPLRKPGEALRARAWAAAAAVVDPECRCSRSPTSASCATSDRDDGTVEVSITPTYSGCPAMRSSRSRSSSALARGRHRRARVKTVLAPAWTTDWMTEDGRAQAASATASRRRPPQASRRALFGVETVACPRCGSARYREARRVRLDRLQGAVALPDCREPFDHFKCI